MGNKFRVFGIRFSGQISSGLKSYSLQVDTEEEEETEEALDPGNRLKAKQINEKAKERNKQIRPTPGKL